MSPNKSAPTPMGAEADSPMKIDQAPQVGLEPTTLRLTVGAEPSASPSHAALQREKNGTPVPTSPEASPKRPIAPDYLPDAYPASLPPCGQDQPGRPTAYSLATVRT